MIVQHKMKGGKKLRRDRVVVRGLDDVCSLLRDGVGGTHQVSGEVLQQMKDKRPSIRSLPTGRWSFTNERQYGDVHDAEIIGAIYLQRGVDHTSKLLRQHRIGT